RHAASPGKPGRSDQRKTEKLLLKAVMPSRAASVALAGMASTLNTYPAERRQNVTPKLLGQGDDIALHSSRFFSQFELNVNLMQIRAHPQEHPPWRDYCQIALLKAVAGLEQVLHAIGFG